MLNRRCANEYNSLADIHLQAYFTNRNLLRHLRKVGLINKKKEIIPESTYRANITRSEQKREVKEALAQAIVYKSLDLQVKRESEIQKRLEEIAKLELVKKIRSERLQRRTQSNPSSRTSSGQHPAWKYFTLYPNRQDSFSASRPQTAYRKQNIRESTSLTSVETASCIDSYSESTTTTTSLRESELPMKHARGDGSIRGHLRKPNRILQPKCGPNLTKYDQEKLKTSPYLYPVHSTEKKPLKLSDIPSGTRNICLPPESMANRRTNCRVTMLYWGTGKNISWEESSPGTEIEIQQQHCGGNTLCVYRGHHKANEKFSFVSHRHLNFPFSLSIYLAGILYLRVSACCEYRHHKGSRLGGPQGLLSLLNVQGASPCARCQLNRQMSEENRKKKMKNDNKASEDEQTKRESTASPLAEIQDIQELSESEDDKKEAENQKGLTKPDQQEGRHEPILFNVSGTVINVEESSSEEEDDYQDDFEDEEEAKEAKTVEGLRKDETNHKEEVGQMKDTDGASGETISSGSEENSLSEEDKKDEKETNDRKEEKEKEVVKIKDDGDIGEEVGSAKSEERNPPGKENDVMGSSSSDENGEKKDKESKSPEDSAENVEEKKDKGSVEDLKNEEKVPITNSVVTREKAAEAQKRDESDIDSQSDTNSSNENSSSSSSSSSPQPPTSRKKSKLKPEMRFRANNHKNVPDSSSESESIAHLPEELEGTEKSKNWIPASQQETI